MVLQSPKHMSVPPENQQAKDTKIAHALANRVDRIILVLECCADNKNYLACLRTCDILGVQNVWIIEAPLPVQGATKQKHINSNITDVCNSIEKGSNGRNAKRLAVEQGKKKGRIARASTQWLDVRVFSSTAAAVKQLRTQGYTIWATDLNPGAVSLVDSSLELPPLLAIVMGSEAAGISQEMRVAADRSVYLPMYGFTESLNVSVATALVLQTLITAHPCVRGNLVGEGRAAQLEAKWRAAAARAPGNRAGALHKTQQQQQQQQHELFTADIALQQLQLEDAAVVSGVQQQQQPDNRSH